MISDQFAICFEQLTGRTPFPWQAALYRCFERGKIPAHCDLPTGLGKTSVIAVWLIALANRLPGVPRRLVYVVNRRTVVDQTTAEVKTLRDNLQKAGWTGPCKNSALYPATARWRSARCAGRTRTIESGRPIHAARR